MPYSFLLERAFLAKEYTRDEPSALRIVGTLLDSAFEEAPRDSDIERLCATLDETEILH
jgi:hypothetical protein